MTQAEWLAGTDPTPMLESRRGRFTERKVRLLDCACCRECWGSLTDGRCRSAVEVAERFADGSATLAALRSAAERAFVAYQEVDPLDADYPTLARYNAAASAYNAAAHRGFVSTSYGAAANRTSVSTPIRLFPDAVLESARAAACSAMPPDADPSATGVGSLWSAVFRAALESRSRLVRDVLGNPFRPVAVDPRWLTSTAVGLAQSIYAERAFDRLPILADALEDAGCDDPDVLAHCRGDGPHVRGCWVVDLVLGRE